MTKSECFRGLTKFIYWLADGQVILIYGCVLDERGLHMARDQISFMGIPRGEASKCSASYSHSLWALFVGNLLG
jgi:hypothetical protein